MLSGNISNDDIIANLSLANENDCVIFFPNIMILKKQVKVIEDLIDYYVFSYLPVWASVELMERSKLHFLHF